MAYVFLYASDPSALDEVEQKAFRDDITKILYTVEAEIQISSVDMQRNWFIRAREAIQEGLVLFDRGEFNAASTYFANAEDIFRSGIDIHKRKVDFIIAPDGICLALATSSSLRSTATPIPPTTDPNIKSISFIIVHQEEREPLCLCTRC